MLIIFFFFPGRELRGLQDINIFVMRLYIKYWFKCSIPTKAASNDLQLFKDLMEYETINKTLVEAVLNVLSRHLWYLSETLIGLSFFNESISLEEKKLMISAMEKPGYDENPKKALISKNIANQLQLCDFVTENTKYFFSAICGNLNLSSFLTTEPENWKENRNYLSAKIKVDKMQIVNDVAERAIAMVSSFNDKLTKNEEEKQLIFQVVERFREEFPNRITKSQMIEKLL